MAVMSLDYEFACDNEISFMLKTSTETGYDFLVFYVDGERKGRWSGEIGWTKASYMVPQGTHTLTWSYEKDGGATGGEDCVWLDYIVLPPMEVVLDVDESGPSTPSTGSGTAGALLVYPNPTDGVLFVETVCTPSLPGGTYHITNLIGQTLMAGQITAEKQQIDVSVLPQGMYFITVAGKTQKFVVK